MMREIEREMTTQLDDMLKRDKSPEIYEKNIDEEENYYYFAKEDIDHAIFTEKPSYPLSDDKDFPRPEFMEKIWRRTMDFDPFELELSDEFKEKTGKDDFIDYVRNNPHIPDGLSTQLVYSAKGMYVDFASPTGDAVFAIPVKFEIVHEYGEKEIPFTMTKCIGMFLEDIKELEGEEYDR